MNKDCRTIGKITNCPLSTPPPCTWSSQRHLIMAAMNRRLWCRGLTLWRQWWTLWRQRYESTENGVGNSPPTKKGTIWWWSTALRATVDFSTEWSLNAKWSSIKLCHEGVIVSNMWRVICVMYINTIMCIIIQSNLCLMCDVHYE